MLRPRLALAGVAAVAFVLTGCSQPEPALDNPGTRQEYMPVTPPTVIRTPVRVPSAPPTQPLPGASADPTGQTTFSPGPDGEQAETSQHGPDGA